MSEIQSTVTFQKKISFGVGCLQFLPKNMDGFKYTLAAYADLVKSSLESIASIKEVTIDFSTSGTDEEIILDDGFPSLNDGELILPSGGHGDIIEVQFDLYIPKRIQKDIGNKVGGFSEMRAENFTVYLRYNYYVPIAFIVSNASAELSQGSEGVVLVRKFLERATNETSECDVFLDFLGPSPFHANFAVCEKPGYYKNHNKIIDFSHTIGPGYDDVKIYVDTDKISIDDAWELIKSRLGSDLDIFYYINSKRSFLMDLEIDAERNLERLLEAEHTEKLFDRFKEFPKKGVKIREAFTSAANLERYHTDIRSNIGNIIREHVFIENSPVKPAIDSLVQELAHTPGSRLQQIISFFEQRRRHSEQMVIVLLAAIVGGMVGSILTMLAGKN